eukprot:scaffold19326_cov39-Attheya_sp.AAC.1
MLAGRRLLQRLKQQKGDADDSDGGGTESDGSVLMEDWHSLHVEPVSLNAAVATTSPKHLSSALSPNSATSNGTSADQQGDYIGTSSGGAMKSENALSNFDACVEAADALAATSVATASGVDIADCSVRVSPDGALLMMPQSKTKDATSSPNSTKTEEQGGLSTTNSNIMSAEAFFAGEEYESAVVVGNDLRPDADAFANGFSARGWEISATTLALHRSQLSLKATGTFVEDLILSRKDAAVHACHSCDTWRTSLSRAGRSERSTLAASIKRSKQRVGAFWKRVGSVRDVTKHQNAPPPAIPPPMTLKSNSSTGARMTRNESTASTQSKASMESVDLSSTEVPQEMIDMSDNSRRTADVSPAAGDEDFRGSLDANDSAPKSYTPTAHVGPLLYPETTLHMAIMAMEQYHSHMAETDANLWRLAGSTSPASNQYSNRSVEVVATPNGKNAAVLGQPQQSDVSTVAGFFVDIKTGAERAAERASKREAALNEKQQRVEDAETRLAQLKATVKSKWDDVHAAELEVTKMVEERMYERSRERERRRLQQQVQRQDEERKKMADAGGGELDTGATEAEIMDLVSQVAQSMEDGSFAPTGLPAAPRDRPRDKAVDTSIHSKPDASDEASSNSGSEDLTLPLASRMEIELEVNLPELRAHALNAEVDVEDAAGTLLNLLSSLDTTRKSARIAAEACLLSGCQAQARCLKSLVQLEKASLEERLRGIAELEAVVDQIDVRKDIDLYITMDKRERDGYSRMGEDDDGGIASALAVLNGHSEGIAPGVGVAGMAGTSVLEGWGNTGNDSGNLSLGEIEDAVDLVFGSSSVHSDDSQKEKGGVDELEGAVEFLSNAVKVKSPSTRGNRSSLCFALNQQRTSNRVQLKTMEHFEGLCRVFDALLCGCDCREPADVANAKMCMMLAQTFYVVETNSNDTERTEDGGRSKRIFVKIRLIGHKLWSDEDFWDQALFQCVSESLTHTGVLEAFKGPIKSTNMKSEWAEQMKFKWHDLRPDERLMASSQVHAVIFAQLGALAHSMKEFGCGVDRACAFVRRLCIRNQLPISQRSILLQHLLRNNVSLADDDEDGMEPDEIEPVVEDKKEIISDATSPESAHQEASETEKESGTDIEEMMDDVPTRMTLMIEKRSNMKPRGKE